MTKNLKSNLYDLMDSKHGRDLVKESIAEVFHDAWTDWTKTISKEEHISKERLDRWEFFWTIPYCQLPKLEKKPEFDLAKRVMTRLGL